MRVLVTDGTMKKSLAVVRAITGVADTIGVASPYRLSTACLSRHADARHHIPERDPTALVDRYNQLGDDYDYLLPVGGRTFEVVSEHRDALHFPMDHLLPDHDALLTAIEKAKTYRLAEDVDVPVPSWKVLTNDAAVEFVERDIGYPAIIKSGRETEDRFVRAVHSDGQLLTAYRAYRHAFDSNPIVQAYLPGVTRGYFCLFIDGRPLGGYAHRRIREFPPAGGASACAQSEVDDELQEYSERLLADLDWHGVAMVEFKESRDGVPHLVEINPKFWGSLDLGVASGMNFPAALLTYAESEQRLELGFRPQRVHWPLSGDLVHAIRRPRSAPGVFWDLVSPSTTSNIRIDDPVPHVFEGMVNAVSSTKHLQ